jgi:hypothetical protein
MLTSFATGVIGVAALLLVWVGVQNAWRRAFSDALDDPDVLAQRIGCGGCDRERDCDRLPSQECSSAEEETQ